MLVSTGYLDRPAPEGEPEVLWWIDPLTDEDLLESLTECYIIDIYQRAE
ncbi:hypothetical protein AB0N29_19595 [Nocardioides sp. NPDC092400]